MNIKQLITTIIIALALASCNNNSDEKYISLENTLSVYRISEPIVLKETFVKNVLKNNDAKNIYFETIKGEKIPFQVDEIDGEKEFSLELDFKANEKRQILVKISDKPIATFKKYTNIRLGKDANNDGIYEDIKEEVRDANHLPGAIPVLYQMEGISWENDKLGFRTYWDKRNGKDIWGKTTSEMVLDSIGLPNTPSYHDIQAWGTDVLKVGNSLGAGALAMIKNNKLVRLGETKKTSFKIISEGPVRAIFNIYYEGWVVEDESYNLTQTIEIWKGKYWYKSDVVLEGNGAEKIKLVTGITNIALEDNKYTKIQEGDKTIVYTFGNQTEQKELMGLALILDSSRLNKIVEAPNTGSGRSIDGNSPITHTFYTDTKAGDKLTFMFAMGWERTDEEFKSAKGFEKMLSLEAKKLNSAIEISSK